MAMKVLLFCLHRRRRFSWHSLNCCRHVINYNNYCYYSPFYALINTNHISVSCSSTVDIRNDGQTIDIKQTNMNTHFVYIFSNWCACGHFVSFLTNQRKLYSFISITSDACQYTPCLSKINIVFLPAALVAVVVVVFFDWHLQLQTITIEITMATSKFHTCRPTYSKIQWILDCNKIIPFDLNFFLTKSQFSSIFIRLIAQNMHSKKNGHSKCFYLNDNDMHSRTRTKWSPMA